MKTLRSGFSHSTCVTYAMPFRDVTRDSLGGLVASELSHGTCTQRQDVAFTAKDDTKRAINIYEIAP